MSHFLVATALMVALAGPLVAQPLEGNWNEFNRSELESLMRTLGKSSAGYDPARPPYAVFDWDNTSVFLDVEEATLVYQADRLAFSATPAQMDRALRVGLPQDKEIKALVDDVIESYAWLYLRLHAGGRLEEVKDGPHHQNFRAKLLKLYQLLEDRYGPETAYPWMPYRFTGMTAEEVREITRQAITWQLSQPIESVVWESPDSLSGKAGQVSVSWSNGLRLLPEMQGLYRALRDSGFDVWVCSASFVEGIRQVSSDPEFGYLNPPDRTIGLELERDDRGRYLPQLKAGTELTYAKGKTRTIERLLISRYHYGPALVGGDSNGDADMLMDFPDTRIGLIVDAKRPADSPIGRLAARARALRGQRGARLLVQDRDESSGRMIP